jgi:nucleotide-binding universal stress UspA family protein
VLEKILVPLDGSELADRVLPIVRGLASRSSEVLLLHVMTDEVGATPELVRSGARYLEQKRLALTDSIERVRFDLMSGDPAEAILGFAETYEPSLIALATHGRTGLARIVHGSVTETLLHRSRFPILAVNPFCLASSVAPRELVPRSVLIPLDGTQRSAAILPLVREIARGGEARVTLLHVVEPLAGVPVDLAFSLGGTGALDSPIRASEAAAFLEDHARDLEAAGIRVRTVARIGTPATSICEVAREVGADLVAMATHGRSGISRLFFGSCCEDVLHLARCPVLALKAAPVAPSAALAAGP